MSNPTQTKVTQKGGWLHTTGSSNSTTVNFNRRLTNPLDNNSIDRCDAWPADVVMTTSSQSTLTLTKHVANWP